MSGCAGARLVWSEKMQISAPEQCKAAQKEGHVHEVQTLGDHQGDDDPGGGPCP